MQIKLERIENIRPYAHNPRQNDSAVDAVARSIDEFGFRQPIVIDVDGLIIVGHTRYKAAVKLGLEKVPVHVARGMTPEKIRAYRIADNRIADIATWDLDLLPEELAALRADDFDLSLIGFSDEELNKLFGEDISEGLPDADEVPEPPDEPISRMGDLWILGNHRLLCGDSGKTEDVDRLLDGAKIQLVNCDPPYNACLMYLVAA